jgi:hypothetical protein
LSSAANSAALSTRSTAAAESLIVSGRLAPGIGTTTGPAAAVLLRQAQLTVTLATEQTVVGAGR